MSTSTIAEHTIQGDVTRLDQLRGADGGFLAGTVDVAGNVGLFGLDLKRLPVRFGAVDGTFNCGWNRLTSLEGAPGAVGRSFFCHNNLLISLEGAPGVVGGYFFCAENRLTSLVGVNRIVRRIDGTLNIKENPIEHGGIGLLLVERLTKINTDQPGFEIINRHLGQGMKGVLHCQEALHEAGLERFARL